MSQLEIVGGKPREKGCPFAWGMAMQQVPGVVGASPVFIQGHCVQDACKAWRLTERKQLDGAIIEFHDCHALRPGPALA